jgi:hypothetical protein
MPRKICFLSLPIVLAGLPACGARSGLLSGSLADGGVAAEEAGPSVRYGLLTAETTESDLSGPELVLATFYQQEDLPPACASVGSRGTCSVVTCPASPSLPPSANAGTIVASVGSQSTSIPYVGTSPSGMYSGANLNFEFTTGDTITLQGPGGPDVPPFEVSATASNLVQLDLPWFTMPTTIDTTQPLPLAWQPASAGDAVFEISDANGHELVCFFDASSSGASVPQGDLASLKALAGGAATHALFLVASRATSSVPGWQIQLSVIVWYGGDWSQYGSVVLQ